MEIGPDDFGFPECKCTWGNIHCGDERHLQQQRINGKRLIGVILNERPADPMLPGVYKIERRFRTAVVNSSLEEPFAEEVRTDISKAAWFVVTGGTTMAKTDSDSSSDGSNSDADANDHETTKTTTITTSDSSEALGDGSDSDKDPDDDVSFCPG